MGRSSKNEQVEEERAVGDVLAGLEGEGVEELEEVHDRRGVTFLLRLCRWLIEYEVCEGETEDDRCCWTAEAMIKR